MSTHATAPHPLHRLLLRALFVLSALLCMGNGCSGPGAALPAARPGLVEYQALALRDLFGVVVNLAGGNAHITRTDWTLDTDLGRFEMAHHYDSAAGDWHWSFDMSFDGSTFVDDSGRAHDVTALSPGDAIPGTTWVYLGPASIKTKGGLLHEFSSHGILERIRWEASATPAIEFQATVVFAQARVGSAKLCLPYAGSCTPFFDVTWNGLGKVGAVTDRSGRSASYDYDPAGRLVSDRDPLANDRGWPGWRYEYTAGLLSAQTSSENVRTEIGYQPDSGGRVTSVQRMGSATPPRYSVRYYADHGLHATTVTDPTGAEWPTIWDDSYRVTAQIGPSGESHVVGWGSHSGLRVSRYIDPSGVETTLAYGGGDDPVTLSLPSGNVVTIAYQASGQNRTNVRATPIASIIDDLGMIESRSYDGQGRVVAITNGAGEARSFTWWAERLSSATAANGALTTFEYEPANEHGRPDTIRTGTSSVETRTYDAVGNALTGENFESPLAAGSPGIVSRSFDAGRNLSGLLLEDLVSDELLQYPSEQATLWIEWRSDGRPTAIRRPGGGDSEFDYDALGNLVARRDRVDGLWVATSFEYDAHGRLTATLLPNGMRREQAFDAQGRLVSRARLQGGTLEALSLSTYAGNRLESLLDTTYAGLPARRHGYDAAGRPDHVTFPGGESIAIDYDVRSRVIRERFYYASGLPLRTLEYDYDAAGRTVEIRDDGALLARSVFANGVLEREEFAGGLRREYHYDPESWLRTHDEVYNGANDLLASTTFARGLCAITGNSGSCTLALGGSAPGLTYEEYKLLSSHALYEPLGGLRLALFRANASPVEADDVTLFGHDLLGNLARRIRIGASPPTETEDFVYNAEGNRLLRTEDGATGAPQKTFAYDAAGYVVERNGTAITWNASGRVTSVGATHAFTWALDGSLVSSTLNGIPTQRRFGGRVAADAGGVEQSLSVGMCSIELADGGTRCRHQDSRGNISFVTDESGSVVTQYTYGPYSRRLVHGDDVDPVRFGRGTELDDDLVILGARLYDQSIGRFLAPDPIFQVVNQYAYTTGNPFWLSDPSGLEQGPSLGQALTTAGADMMAAGAVIAASGTLGGSPFNVAVGSVLSFIGGVTYFVGRFIESSHSDRSDEVTPRSPEAAPDVFAAPADLGVSTAGGGGCAPTHVAAIPDLRGLLELLAPLQILLAVRIRSRRRRLRA